MSNADAKTVSAPSGRFPRLIDVCPQYKTAFEAYERAANTPGAERAASLAWERVGEIAAAFQCGVEYVQKIKTGGA